MLSFANNRSVSAVLFTEFSTYCVTNRDSVPFMYSVDVAFGLRSHLLFGGMSPLFHVFDMIVVAEMCP